jgi:plastocyanin
VRIKLRKVNVLVAFGLFGGFAPPGQPANDPPQTVTVHVKIREDIKGANSSNRALDDSDVVVWLRPLDSAVADSAAVEGPAKRPQVIQKNKSFHPHLTVVRVGSVVDFPNHDPFFHNVFSSFNGKRFDLGLYEAGATDSVRFDHPGVSYLFCNIHPEMSAIVIAVDTPYYGVSERRGIVTITGPPDGKYELHVWFERSTSESLKGLTRTVHLSSDSRDLGTIVVPEDPAFTPAHKNKYGQDYPPPPKQGYPQP